MLTIRVSGGTEYPIALATPDLLALCEKWYDAATVQEQSWDSADLIDWPAPDFIPQPDPVIGKLFFPVVGARRWARGDFLLDATSLASLRADLAYSNAVVLSFTDSEAVVEDAREFNMYLLASRPLVDNAAGDDTRADDLHVITVVDDRYYWQYATGLRDSFDETPVSWTELISWCATRLGNTIAAGTVDSDYGAPTGRWRTDRVQGRSTAHLLDSALALIGHRLVWKPDGTGRTAPYDAEGAAATTFHADNLDRHNGGGLIASTELRNGVPSSVTAYFYPGTDADGAENVTLLSLGIGAYGSATGATGTAYAWLDLASTAAGATRTALATQWAKDFYYWQLAPLDADYAGFTTVPDSGYVGHVEYYHTAREGMTWVRRMPVNYANLKGRDWSAGDAGDAGPGNLVEVTAFNAGTRYHTVKKKTWTGSPGDVADYSPATTFTTCRASTRQTQAAANYQIPTGTLCYLWAIPDVPGDYWIEPTGDNATSTTPGVVSAYSQFFGGHKWFVNGVTVSDGLKASTIRPGGNVDTDTSYYWFGDCLRDAPRTAGNTLGIRQGYYIVCGDGAATDGGNWLAEPDTSVTGGAWFTRGVSIYSNIHWLARETGQSPGLTTGNLLYTVFEPSFELWGVYNSRTVVTPSGPTAKYWFTGDYTEGSDLRPNFGASVYTRYPDVVGKGETGNEAVSKSVFVFSPFFVASDGFGVKRIGVTFTGVRVQVLNGAGAGTPGGGTYDVDITGGIVTRLARVTDDLPPEPADPAPAPGQPRRPATGVVTVSNGEPYYADDPVTRTVFYLPATAETGARYEIIGRGAAGWEILQRSGMQVRGFDSTDTLKGTTVGTGGALRGPQYSSVVVECVVDGTTFVVVSFSGPITWI